ncbi:hypothetical protein [Colwellia chukchiensis]|uniref:hypothetical protein n=1 Tax=Colwellia chukchiensis TaxID=641665 RepID=UPI000A171AA2|nr:hypothetical protein [Colwellia chukchiensis]
MQTDNNQTEHVPLTTKSSTSVTRSLSQFMAGAFAAQGGYYADKLYRFQSAENGELQCQALAENTKASFRWLVLGREHYFETSKDYPIASKRDLKKALQFDDNTAPFNGVTLRHIERLNEQSHRVTFWVINPKVFQVLATRPWLLLPESYVLAKNISPQASLASVARFNQTLFIAKTGLGIFSGIQSQYVNTIEQFAFATGAPLNNGDNQPIVTSKTEFVSYLQQGLTQLEFQHLAGFFLSREKTDWQQYPWKMATIVSGSFLVCYFALSSAWLVYKNHQLEQQLAQQSEQVNIALNLQKQLRQQIQWQATLAQPLQQQTPYWNAWPLVLESIHAGARITGLAYKGNAITINGITKDDSKATDILAKLSQNAMALAPSFSKPVRKHRGSEQFAISFGLQPQYQPIENPSENLHNAGNTTAAVQPSRDQNHAK